MDAKVAELDARIARYEALFFAAGDEGERDLEKALIITIANLSTERLRLLSAVGMGNVAALPSAFPPHESPVPIMEALRDFFSESAVSSPEPLPQEWLSMSQINVFNVNTSLMSPSDFTILLKRHADLVGVTGLITPSYDNNFLLRLQWEAFVEWLLSLQADSVVENLELVYNNYQAARSSSTFKIIPEVLLFEQMDKIQQEMSLSGIPDSRREKSVRGL